MGMSVNVLEKAMENNGMKMGTGVACISRNDLLLHIISYNSFCSAAGFARVFDMLGRHV